MSRCRSASPGRRSRLPNGSSRAGHGYQTAFVTAVGYQTAIVGHRLPNGSLLHWLVTVNKRLFSTVGYQTAFCSVGWSRLPNGSSFAWPVSVNKRLLSARSVTKRLFAALAGHGYQTAFF
jgi:hypothetical protein